MSARKTSKSRVVKKAAPKAVKKAAKINAGRSGSLAQRYRALDGELRMEMKQPDEVVRPEVLICFPYQHPRQPAEIVIDTEEFSALCPWTGLPDYGCLTVRYRPRRQCLELKSLKYYLLGYRSAGIVQEHAAARILADLVAAVRPRNMVVELDYRPRGGLHTLVRVDYPPAGGKA